MKKLLLHVCCAPCAVYVFERLARNHDVTGFFFNPNIQPKTEYHFRKEEVRKLFREQNWPVIFGSYRPNDWFTQIEGHEDDPERGARCSICFSVRLYETFRVAQEKNFPLVASTLSISPYKVTAQINAAGETLGRKFGIEFLGENFKKQDGYRIAQAMAKEHGIQHQNYCGCVFSRRERERRKSRK